MADCTQVITAGITLNCDDINAAVGVEKDLILVNYADFNKEQSLAIGNIDDGVTSGNPDGYVDIFIADATEGTGYFTFEGTDYSVQPTISTEVKEDGNAWYIHTLLFTVYNKESQARNTLEDLGWSRVVAIVVDRSTGLYELFGADQGLKISALDRAYVGTQTSNFYQVTIATPDIAVVREGNLGYLFSGSITTEV